VVTDVWDVKELAKKYQITTAVQLQTFIAEKLGVLVSVQTLRAVMRVSPAAPRVEMIQLLCDAFNCRSDAFYVVNPNPARAQQWAKDRSEGKKPSTLYQSKAAEPVNYIVETQDEIVQGESTRERMSLRATFTDPRALFKKRVKCKEQPI